MSFAGSNGGGPKSCGGGGCDDEEGEAETIRSRLRGRGRGRATETEPATAAAEETAGELQCGRRRAAALRLLATQKKLVLPLFDPPDVDAAAPLRARAAASGMGRRRPGYKSGREEIEGRATTKKKRQVVEFVSMFLPFSGDGCALGSIS